mgnify:CR=1 FL=1
MKEIWNWIQVTFAVVGGWLGYFLGGWDGFLYALLTFVVIDYITGLMCAVLDKKLSSEVGFRGIFKKVLIFSLLIKTLLEMALLYEQRSSFFIFQMKAYPYLKMLFMLVCLYHRNSRIY